MFAGVHIFRKLGFRVFEGPIAAFHAAKHKKNYKTYSEILKIVNMGIENVEALRDMINAINADSILRQAFGYAKPVQQPQLNLARNS